MKVLTAFVGALCLFSLLPIVTIMVMSLTGEGIVRFPPRAFGLGWYAATIQSEVFRSAFLFSLTTAAVVALVAGVLGTLVAFAVARLSFRGKGALTGLVVAPLSLSHVVIGVALLMPLAIFGVPVSPTGLIVGHVLVTTPFVFRMMSVSLAAIPRSRLWSSQSLGASHAYTFFHVILPEIRPAAVAALVFAFLISLDEVNIGIFMALPGRTTFPVVIFEVIQSSPSPLPVAASGLLIVFSVTAVLILDRSVGLLGLLLGQPVRSR